MKVLVIGKNGQLANELISEKPQSIELLCLGRTDIDITSTESLHKSISAFKPNIIINSSAYTAVDKAESDIEAAYAINQHAVANIAQQAKLHKARLLHVSTDFVFDGKQNRAYHTNDKTQPCSVYGASKLAGEHEVLSQYPENSSIIRTSWLYSSFGNNFVKTMLRLMEEREELSVVCDQIGCPTYAKSLAKFIWQLCYKESIAPIYHWSDYGVASWYDFAIAIQEIAFNEELITKKININPIPASSYPTPAVRPYFSLLESSDSYLIEPTIHWRKQLRSCLAAPSNLESN